MINSNFYAWDWFCVCVCLCLSNSEMWNGMDALVAHRVLDKIETMFIMSLNEHRKTILYDGVKWSDRCDPINFNISYRIVIMSADHIFIIECSRVHWAQWFQASLQYRRATATPFNFTVFNWIKMKEGGGNCL